MATPISCRLPVELLPVGERSCQPGGEHRRPQRAGRQRCRQLGQGLVHLPGRQVLELDRAGLADRMTGKTPVTLNGAGLPLWAFGQTQAPANSRSDRHDEVVQEALEPPRPNGCGATRTTSAPLTRPPARDIAPPWL